MVIVVSDLNTYATLNSKKFNKMRGAYWNKYGNMFV